MAPTREIHRRVRTGCITCRKRHMKCDERKPQCRHCEIGSRDCRYDTPENSSRRSDSNGGFQFDSNHVWLDTPSEVTFVHTVQVRTEGEESIASSTSTPVQFSPDADNTTASDPLLDGQSPGMVMIENSVRNGSIQPTTATPSRDVFDFASPHSTTSGGSIDTIVDPIKSLVRMRTSGSTIYTPGPTQPLSDPQTASLLQHYMNNLACWFDVNDPHRQFETFVPYLALSCPILLHAVLALSACHLSRLDGSYDEFYASQFHDLCIQGLIPALADPSTALDNVLPISTVVLRMYEMMSYETDHQRHLKGCSSLFRHNRKNIGFRALKRTAFWTYFREEIMVALATGKPTTIRPSNWKVDITWGGDFDYVKTEKMTMLVAEVVDYCFTEECQDQGDPIKWDELQREVDTWKETLPESFQPLYVMEEIKPFPRISYLCTWHIIAMQFYHLVKVLLALHNPHPMRGIEFLQFARATEAEILKHTLQLCGMTKALGNRHPGVLVNAVQPLVICGRSLKKPEEQSELINMLQRIEEVTAISTSQGIQSLKEAWGLHSGL